MFCCVYEEEEIIYIQNHFFKWLKFQNGGIFLHLKIISTLAFISKWHEAFNNQNQFKKVTIFGISPPTLVRLTN